MFLKERKNVRLQEMQNDHHHGHNDDDPIALQKLSHPGLILGHATSPDREPAIRYGPWFP
jgi:hypothetical protein